MSVSPSAKPSRGVLKITNSPTRKRRSPLTNELEGYFVHMFMCHVLFLSDALSLCPLPFHATFIPGEAPAPDSVTMTATEPPVLVKQRPSRKNSPAKSGRVPALPMAQAADSTGGYICTFSNVVIPCIDVPHFNHACPSVGTLIGRVPPKNTKTPAPSAAIEPLVENKATKEADSAGKRKADDPSTQIPRKKTAGQGAHHGRA